MPTTRRFVQRATARDLLVLAHPRLWRCYPLLPVIRQPVDGGPRELGVLYDARGISGIYGYSTTVFLTNLFALPQTEAAFLALPKCVYDNLDELLDDGWVVD